MFSTSADRGTSGMSSEGNGLVKTWRSDMTVIGVGVSGRA